MAQRYHEGHDNDNASSPQNRNTNVNINASFYSVVSAALGRKGAKFIEAAMSIKGFGVATSYFITVGDCMADSFRYILGTATARSAISSAAKRIERYYPQENEYQSQLQYIADTTIANNSGIVVLLTN